MLQMVLKSCTLLGFNPGAVPGLNNIPLGSFNGVGSHVQTWVMMLF